MTVAKDKYSDLYPNIDKKLFRETMRYEPETGRLWRQYKKGEWKVIKRKQHGVPGYIFIFRSVYVTAHDAVWFLHNKEWPKEKLVAVDGDLCNTEITNLMPQSETKKQIGNYSITPAGFGRFHVRVYDHPHFVRSTSLNSKRACEKWAKQQLNLYNRYAYPTKAAAEFTSESKELPVKGVWFHNEHKLYEIRINVQGTWKHYAYCKNVEDALETQKVGQAESDEIWGAYVFNPDDAWWNKKKKKDAEAKLALEASSLENDIEVMDNE
jgi:hypothetical protein